MAMHEDEVEVGDDLVRVLVDEQFPRWRGQPIRRLPQTGTVHAIFRVGDDVAVRFPLRRADTAAVRTGLVAEQAALAELGEHLTIAVPQPLGVGEPAHGYPMPWAAQTWLPGHPAWATAATGGTDALIDDVAALVGELRAIPKQGRSFARRGRGGDLQSHDDWVARCLTNSEGLLPVTELRSLWQHLRALPRHSPDTITHGDLIPGNLLVDDGRLTGVLDPGMFGAADPALDLIVAWHLVDAEHREHLRQLTVELDVTDLDWERSKAWAFEQSIGLVWYYESTNPTMAELGRRTLGRIMADT